MKEFTIIYQYQQVYDYQCVNLERWLKNQTIQRKNMARRLNRKYPLFAIEMMREKYPDYNEEQFKEDIRVKKKGKSMRKVKNPLTRQGRWPLYEKAMMNFQKTKEQKYLEEAQRLRSRMFLPFGIELRLGKMGKWYEFPSTTPYGIIKELSSIKTHFKSKIMKCYVIMLAKTFPATHPRAGQPTRFDEKILDGIKKVEMGTEPPTWKIHTIRENHDFWHDRMAEVAAGRAFLSLRQWAGRPYHSKQVELFKLTHENGVGFETIFIFEKHFITIGKSPCRNSNELIADNDGLYIKDFDQWFGDEKRGQLMGLIHFTKFRYSK